MTLVVDASVAVKFLTWERGSQEAFTYLDAEDPLIAPDIVVPEVANALWKKVRNSELLEVHAEAGLDDLPQFFVRLTPTLELMKSAFNLSFRLRHAVYDCVYLALAIRDGATLVTADEKFAKAVVRGRLERHIEVLQCS